MHKGIQLKHFATDTIMHNQSEKRYLEFSAVSHIYRSLFYICLKRSIISFLFLSNSKSKRYLSKQLETDLVLWLTPRDLHQTQESTTNKQSYEEVSWKGGQERKAENLKFREMHCVKLNCHLKPPVL